MRSGLLEALLVGPLPLVLELGQIRRLVVGGVEVIDPGFQAGVHQRQILVGQGDVEHQVRLDPLDQGHGLGDLVGIDLLDGHGDAGAFLDRLRQWPRIWTGSGWPG